jgi:hypothetical protein
VSEQHKGSAQVTQTPLMVNAPKFYGSTLHINITSNECSILFGRPHFTIGGDGDDARAEAVCIVQMSPQTMKDLVVLMERNVKRYEEEWGVIETQYTRDTAKK